MLRCAVGLACCLALYDQHDLENQAHHSATATECSLTGLTGEPQTSVQQEWSKTCHVSCPDTQTMCQHDSWSDLEHVTALVLHQGLLVIDGLAGPVRLEAGSRLLHAQQAFPLLIHKAAADSLHIGEIHTHQLPPVLRVQASEWQAWPVPADDDQSQH